MMAYAFAMFCELSEMRSACSGRYHNSVWDGILQELGQFAVDASGGDVGDALASGPGYGRFCRSRARFRGSRRRVVTTGESSTLRANAKGGAGGVFPVTVLTDWNWVKERTSVARR
jgi:hypothetical protein